jgi:3-deoxy-D-manno-octulosonic-acid transferase
MRAMRPSFRLRMLAYNLLLLAATPFFLAWFAGQWLVMPRRRVGVAQRFGAAPEGKGPAIWVHAVSVGEAMAVLPVLRLLRRRLPEGWRLVVSTVTVTGQQTLRREFPEADEHFYFPLDLTGLPGRALDRIRPSLLVVVETELWPNLLAACSSRGIPVVVVNGRLSDRSFEAYGRFGWLVAPLLRSLSLVLAQSAGDAARFVSLGADPERVRDTGNLKFDRAPKQVELPASIARWKGEHPLLVAGSTHRGEESALLALLRHPGVAGTGLRLALVPRHPERFDEVATLPARMGVASCRYSEVAAGKEPDGEVMVVDAMGILDGFYALADICFVGGSLVPVGGHNLLEPAMAGKPVLTGPRVHNFRDIAALLTGAGGATIVDDGGALAEAVARLLADPDGRRRMGMAAAAAVSASVGASERVAGAILGMLGGRA